MSNDIKQNYSIEDAEAEAKAEYLQFMQEISKPYSKADFRSESLQVIEDIRDEKIKISDVINDHRLPPASLYYLEINDIKVSDLNEKTGQEIFDTVLKDDYDHFKKQEIENPGIVFQAKFITKNDVPHVEFSAPSMGIDKQAFPIENLKTSVREGLKQGLSQYLENEVLNEKNLPKFSKYDSGLLKLHLEDRTDYSQDLQEALDLKIEKNESGYRVHVREYNLHDPEYDAQRELRIKKEFQEERAAMGSSEPKGIFQKATDFIKSFKEVEKPAEVLKTAEVEKPKKSMDLEM